MGEVPLYTLKPRLAGTFVSLELSDAKVYEPYIRARLGTAARFCEIVATPRLESNKEEKRP